MTASHLHLVESHDVDQEIAEIAGDMFAAKRALMRKAGKPVAVPPTGTGDVSLMPPDDGGPQRYDDLANSKRFLQIIGDDMLFVVEPKKWFIWSGTHWKLDRDDFVFEFAEDFAASLYDTAIDEAAMKNAKRANNRAGFNAFLELSMRKQSVSIETFDRQPHLLNCLNGTLDLRTGDLRPHDKADRITRVVNCDYDADGLDRPNAFIPFLERIQPDASIRAFLQRSIGYSLLGSVRERAFWILYGTGNNGKSIFTNLFNNLLGEYASTTPAASLMASKQSTIPNDIARLRGKRFILIPETEENERLNASLVKSLSAGDTVSARFLFGEYFDFEFSGKLWIATNHKPTITDHSKGMWDRMKIVPFSVDVPANEVVKSDDLMRSLMADAPAVLAWAVQGCRDYYEADGLDTPPVIQTEIDAYRREQDSIAQFLEERCQTWEQAVALKEKDDRLVIFESDFQVPNGDLYAAYKKFCEQNGEYLRSHRRLAQNMKERGFQQRNSGGRYWDGIRLTETEK